MLKVILNSESKDYPVAAVWNPEKHYFVYLNIGSPWKLMKYLNRKQSQGKNNEQTAIEFS